MVTMRSVVALLAVEIHAIHAIQLVMNQQTGYYKQPMTNIEDVSYVASMDIGGQSLAAILDTGSSDVEVISSRCGFSCYGAGVDRYYDRNISSTYKEGDLIQLKSYESGDVWAQSGEDLVSFGSLKIKNQAFWEVVYAKLDILQYGNFQAIVGVGPPGVELSQVKKEANALEYMKFQFEKLGFEVPEKFSADLYVKEVPKMKSVLESLNCNTFSVCLGRTSGSDGYFVWNDDKPINKPSFREIDVAGKVTWGTTLTDVVAGEEGIDSYELACKSRSCVAIIDSGTSLMMVPSSVHDDLNRLLQKLEASCDQLDGLPMLTFKLGGQEIRLPPSAYMGLVDNSFLELSEQQMTSDLFPFSAEPNKRRSFFSSETQKEGQTCELLIGKIDVETQLGQMWILGMPFFREYYTTFSLGSNLTDRKARKVYIARADGDCEPEAPQLNIASVYKYDNTPFAIKTRKLRVPGWARKAHRKGYLEI